MDATITFIMLIKNKSISSFRIRLLFRYIRMNKVMCMGGVIHQKYLHGHDLF